LARQHLEVERELRDLHRLRVEVRAMDGLAQDAALGLAGEVDGVFLFVKSAPLAVFPQPGGDTFAGKEVPEFLRDERIVAEVVGLPPLSSHRKRRKKVELTCRSLPLSRGEKHKTPQLNRQ
jgi:hypothetical protein